MKFVNKLSVISLIVLMFSFINIASAGGVDTKDYPCNAKKVSNCDVSKTQAACAGTYRGAVNNATPPGDRTMNCVWDKTQCRATQFCSTQKITNCKNVDDCTKAGWGIGAVCALGQCGYGG